jgi:hypothetical protein
VESFPGVSETEQDFAFLNRYGIKAGVGQWAIALFFLEFDDGGTNEIRGH